MAWTDQCKIAFKTNADALLWKQKGQKGIMKILKVLSEQSGIPQKTLYRWWNELEKEKSLKNETNEEAIENKGETPDSNTAEIAEIAPPACTRCEKNTVYIDVRTKKPYSEKSKYHGLCGTCRDRQLNISKVDSVADENSGLLAICPKCDYGYYINRERIK